MRTIACVAALLVAWSAVGAAELVVRVADARGQPAVDAVVTLVAATPADAERAPGRAIKVVDQRDEQFLPYVEVFRPGDTVVFRNSDSTRHHVYSFAAARSFDFVLGPGEASEPMVLERAGIIAVGCNIHDPMIAYLVVSDAERIARTGASGTAKFRDLAPGTWSVRAWHPQLRPGRPDVATTVVLDSDAAAATRSLTLSLLPDPRGRDRERAAY